MVNLEVTSTDKLGYEWESMSFTYNNTTLFRLTNHKLNRGGKGLAIINSNNETVISCGRWNKGFHKKVVKTLFSLGFVTSEKDIIEAIEKRQKENVEKHDAILISELNLYKSRQKEIAIESHKLANKISTVKKQIIQKHLI